MREKFELVRLKGGEWSIRSLEFNETMHIGSGPRSEALALHVEGPGVVRRVAHWEGEGRFVVWDVGLGSAGNAVTLLEELRAAAARGVRLAEVELHSFDVETALLEFALLHSRELGYLVGWEGVVGRLLAQGEVEALPGVRWVLHRGDFAQRVGDVAAVPAAMAIFHDPYSPAKNPAMWGVELFEAMRRPCEGVPTVLTNYTRSTAVRVSLALAGWFVGVGAATGGKEETTVAATRLELLEQPLGREWLERVGRSVNAAPLRGGEIVRGPIEGADWERLRGLEQFR